MTGAEKWLIAGASGLLGVRLVRHLRALGRDVVALHCRHPLPGNLERFGFQLDLLDGDDACRRAVGDSAPDAVVNCVGLTNVDQCEHEPEQAALLNTRLAGRIAEASRGLGCRFVQISTDHLWDGTRRLVTEDAPTRPINAYARTKAEGEVTVQQANPQSLIVRTNFFGLGLPWRKSFSDWLSERLSEGHAVDAFSDVFFTPVASDLLCSMIVELVDRNVTGVLNVAGGDRISKHEFALRWAQHAGLDRALIRPASVEDGNLYAPRPRDMSLDCSKAAAVLGRAMPSLNESLQAYDRGIATH